VNGAPCLPFFSGTSVLKLNSARKLRILTVAFLLLAALTPSAILAASVSISITGVEGEVHRNLQAAAGLPPGIESEGRIDERWLERYVRGLKPRIAKALQPFGYYRPEIRISLPERRNGDRQVRIEVDPGKPVRVDKLELELEGAGKDEKQLREQLRAFPLEPGDVLDHGLYQQGKDELRNRAVDLGYLQADYSRHEMLVDPDAGKADIRLRLQTGERYFVGPVEIRGAHEYPPWFLRRFLSIAPGQVFSYERLGRTQRNYYDSDRFSSVRVRPMEDEVENLRVPVSVDLETKPPKRLRPGIGYGTDTGARFSLTYQDLNHLHLGNELAGELKLSEVSRNLGTSYILPSRRRPDASIRLQLSLQEDNLDAYENRLLIAEVEYQRQFAAKRLGSVFLRYHREDFDLAGDRDRALLLLFGIRGSLVRFKDPLRPRSGWQGSMEVRGAHPNLGSDSALLQVLGTTNLLFPLPWRSTFLLRLEGATTLQEDGLGDIPASLRFFAGGDRSIRGYAYQSIGPRNAQGEVEGGKQLALGNLELERALFENWGLALFFDMGGAFNQFTDPNWFRSVGVSLRRYTQIGPVSFAVARQIRVEDPSWRLHLSVGFSW